MEIRLLVGMYSANRSGRTAAADRQPCRLQLLGWAIVGGKGRGQAFATLADRLAELALADRAGGTVPHQHQVLLPIQRTADDHRDVERVLAVAVAAIALTRKPWAAFCAASAPEASPVQLSSPGPSTMALALPRGIEYAQLGGHRLDLTGTVVAGLVGYRPGSSCPSCSCRR